MSITSDPLLQEGLMKRSASIAVKGPFNQVMAFLQDLESLEVFVITSDLEIQDTQSGFRAFSKLAIERLRFDSEGMELSLEMLEDAHEKDLTIQEIPTVIRYDVPKGSNFTALSHGFTVLAWAMVSLSQKKPLLVLGLPGFGLFAAGAAMALNAVNGISDSVDTLVGPGLTAVWIGVLGLSLMATGLVLQSARNFLRHLLVKEFGLD